MCIRGFGSLYRINDYAASATQNALDFAIRDLASNDE
jgi:hypothetical protein